VNELLNTSAYTALQLSVLLFGHLSWSVLYLIVLRNVRRHGVVEIPAAAVAANFAYVTVWGVLHQTNLGSLFVWLNRGAVLIEAGAVLIEGAVFLYVLLNGAKHVRLPEVRRWFKPGMILSYLCWLLMIATFVRQQYDLPSGLISGFIVSMFMSVLYVVIEMTEIDADQYSLVAGWAKLCGNGGGALFCVLAYPGQRFLWTICIITVVLDVIYLLLFRQRRDAAPSRALA
jgi:hypothetical protein